MINADNRNGVLVPSQGYFAKLKLIVGSDARSIPVIGLLYTAQAVLDFLGALLIAPLIYLIASPKSVVKVMAFIPFLPSGASYRSLLLTFLVLLIGVFAARGIISYTVQRAVFTFLARLRERLQTRMLQAYQDMPYEFYLTRNPNEMIAVIYSHVSNVAEMAIGSVLRILGDSIVLLALVAVLVVTNLSGLLVMGPLLMFAILIFRVPMSGKIRIAGDAAASALGRLLTSVQNALEGVKEIRVLGVEQHFLASARQNIRQYTDAFVEYASLSTVPRFFIELLVVTSVASMAIYYVLRGEGGEQVMARLGVFAIVGLRLVPSVQSILGGLNNIEFSRPSVDYVYTDIGELGERGHARNLPQRSTEGAPAFDRLELKQVSYRYPGSQSLALDSIDLTIEFGQSIGVVGPSGSGKSTLIDVLIGLLPPSSGEVLCNGRSIHTPNSEWHSLVAYIPQMLFIIDDTLRRNVALGIPDHEIDEERLELALRQARIDNLPQGADTVLGTRGNRISGGQRQRVALARTFYFERQVIILDEATSALDAEIEKEIVDEIHQLKGKRTLIVIAHRLSTVKPCDFLVRIEKGRIVEKGTFQQVVEMREGEAVEVEY